MVVYADVLVFLNLIINYFLLLAVSKIIRKCCAIWRMVLSAFLGATSSLYIFFPPLSIWIENLLKLTVSVIMILVAFGFKGLRTFLKNVVLLMVVTLGFGGLMYAVWIIFKPNGMVINNSIVYFDISIIWLIGFTVVGYLLFSLLFKILSHSSALAQKCDITIIANKKSITLTGIVDTGNSIEDIFSRGEVIICTQNVKTKLFGCVDIKSDASFKKRYRLLPCSTVSGVDVLEGVRCDKALINAGKQTVTLENPIIAFSKTDLQDSEAIINPKILG